MASVTSTAVSAAPPVASSRWISSTRASDGHGMLTSSPADAIAAISSRVIRRPSGERYQASAPSSRTASTLRSSSRRMRA